MSAKTWQRTRPVLSKQHVRDIRELRAKKVSIRSLAIRYSVSESTIRDAWLGEGAYRGL